MKSIVAILVASFALIACGKKEDATTKQDAQNVPAAVAAPASAPAQAPATEPAKTEESKK